MSSPSPESPRSADRATAPESTERYRRSLFALVIALVAAWVLMLLPLPWSLGSGIAGIAALVLLVRMVILAWRDKRPGMALVSAIIGIPAVLTIVLSALMSAVFYGPMLELQECRASAITQQAQDACQESVEGSVVDWLEGLTGG